MALVNDMESRDSQSVNNPTKKWRSFRRGDFTAFRFNVARSESYGIVTEALDDRLIFYQFDNGYGCRDVRVPSLGRVRKVPSQEAIDYFDSLMTSLQLEVANGGLRGARQAVRHYNLNNLISKLQSNKINPADAVEAKVRQPMTGVYVLEGAYQGLVGSNNLDGLVSDPRLSISRLEAVMGRIKPRGFRDIPYFFFPGSACTLIGYTAYEIPKYAVELVKDPVRLRDHKDAWTLTEEFRK